MSALEKLRRTAYHEAGHVVASYMVGRSIQGVSIIPDDEGTLGHVTHGSLSRSTLEELEFGPINTRLRSIVEKEAIVCYAGDIAEMIVFGDADPEQSESDRHTALDFVERIVSPFVGGDMTCNPELEAYNNWLWIRAENIVIANRPLLDVVAEALLAHKRLTGRRVRKIIRNALNALFAHENKEAS